MTRSPSFPSSMWLIGMFIFGGLSFIPYGLGWLLTPVGTQFSGSLVNQNDFSVYISAIRQGAENHWLYQFNFSPEQWQPAFIYLPYLLVGRLASWLGGSWLFWFHAMRLAALGALGWSLLFWLKSVFPHHLRHQLTGWWLILFGGGLGWLAWPLTSSFAPQFRYFPDLAMSEWSTLMISVNAPHYLLGFSLELILFGCLGRLTLASHENQWLFGAVGAGIGISLVYAHHLATLCIVATLALIADLLRHRRIRWAVWLKTGLILFPTLPFLFYYGFWLPQDPLWAAHLSSPHHLIPAPPLLGLCIGLGLATPLILMGAVRWWQTKQNDLLLCWLLGNLLVMYIPFVSFTGRLTLGWIVPAFTLAAYAIETVLLPALPQNHIPLPSWRRMALWVSIPSTFMSFLLLIQNILLRPYYPNYLPQADVQAVQWLAQQTTPHDLFLSAYPMSNYLSSIDSARIFVGQFFHTIDFAGKMAAVDHFWHPETTLQERQAFVQEWGITYIFQGSYENQLPQADLPGIPIYQQNNITILKTVPNQ